MSTPEMVESDINELTLEVKTINSTLIATNYDSDDSIEETKEEELARLAKHPEQQAAFIDIVNEMIETKCPLPNNFKCFYRVMTHQDRCGTGLSIRPFLTEEAAYADCGFDQVWEGKYGSDINYEVLDSRNSIALENYHTDNDDRPEHEIDIKPHIYY